MGVNKKWGRRGGGGWGRNFLWEWGGGRRTLQHVTGKSDGRGVSINLDPGSDLPVSSSTTQYVRSAKSFWMIYHTMGAQNRLKSVPENVVDERHNIVTERRHKLQLIIGSPG